MVNMKGKTVLITGGGRGVGFGIATAFAKEGANVVITGRTLSSLDQAAEQLRKLGVQVLGLLADGAKEQDVERVVRQTAEQFGGIDVLINNAQTSKSGVLLEDHTTGDFDLAIYTGLYAAFFYMRACFPYLKESRGAVINFASGAGLSGLEGQASYAAAKEGIRGMSRVAAREWGKYGINVNVVCPLAMTQGLEQWKAEYPDMFEKSIRSLPMGRYGDPERDIGRVCVFLASEDAGYITGETISVQGGSGMRP